MSHVLHKWDMAKRECENSKAGFFSQKLAVILRHHLISEQAYVEAHSLYNLHNFCHGVLVLIL